ncbi:hypothetical protein [Isachenkonia alkalipeptolytica]|uniref:Uncharacterized protein n=1 Tax=Isachenkonia alkalipeptolytica TaxID=2565777 RepID=A0AA43XMN0_9CLOT|nr:hypothetical protein [Isachenkonia alkalipeptolytica]NBG89500.1 hypothetical protein [Isachenkonia alkalipeptolytica]
MSSEEEEISLEKSVNSLLNKVKGQERDILRFTLMQDILSISTANHYMSEDKRELLEWVQKQLLISDEQMKIFNGELNQESGLASKTKEVDRWKAYRSNFSKCLAMGIPLTFLYYSQHNAYRHDFKSFALLQIDKKINPRKSYVSLGKYLLLGGVLYTGVLWGMNQKKRHQEKLEKMLETESKNLISRGKRYLEEDLIFCQKIFRKDTLNENQINFKILMDKTLQIMDEEF